MKIHRLAFIYIVCLGGVSLSCSGPAIVSVFPPDPSTDAFDKRIQPLQMPVDSTHWIYGGLKKPKAVFQFYKASQFRLGWLTDSISGLPDSMLVFLKRTRLYGLLPQDYHESELENLHMASYQNMRARMETLLTDAFLNIAEDLKYGRLRQRSMDENADSLVVEALKHVLVNNDTRQTLESLEPQYSQYYALRMALGGLLHGLKPFDRDVLMAGITYDSIELHQRVQAIEINMERWRSEDAYLTGRYIWINVPSYQLQLIEDGRNVLESRIIVGKPKTPSPELSSSVECFAVYPYWHVPRKIAVEEFLPLIQRDTSFITANNFDVLDRKGRVLNSDTLNWKKYNKNNFPFTLRQREGRENSLGVIKFVFDNPYAVFLHDTNAKGLFNRNVRALSHGCIRMEKAVDLAKYLAPAPDKIEQMIDLKERQTINLSHPIPIHIRYFTCEVIRGIPIFYDDIYGKDLPITEVLYDGIN